MSSKVALLQLPTLSMSGARIDYYLRIAKESGASLTLLGEYVLNSFFAELVKMPNSMINEQISHKFELMKELSVKHSIVIVSPFIKECENGYIKGIAKFENGEFEFWEQNFLINYSHWNEKEFFKNSKKELEIATFEHDGFKFGVMNGFDMHFDICWVKMFEAEVDAVLVPTASTFESNHRWESMLKTRAFTNLVYILRANRIGKTKIEESSFDFYGDSFAISPNGLISSRLKDEEGILLFELSNEELKLERSLWKFREALSEKLLP
ncbi:MAG: carbon-nitrogen hydrolase family protein [Campylobacteraceae bacterium]|nr:carbon-nitrogen hydrolase family protein [Campylobacteraceae bacterium]